VKNRFLLKDDTRVRRSLDFDQEDILSDLTEKKGTSLFLGKYTLKEVLLVLSKKNFLKDAKKRNLWPLNYAMDSSQYPLQRFQIFYKERKNKNIIVDLKIKEGTLQSTKNTPKDFPDGRYKFLILEWLTLQNPKQVFYGERMPLPGQNHPGLNLGKKVIEVFSYLARISQLDGLIAFPAYFHNALLFSRYFRFLRPEKEAEVRRIRKVFRNISFRELAWIVHLNCLKSENHNVYEWEAEEQIFPLNKSLKRYFESKTYRERVKEIRQSLDYLIDWECYKQKQHP
jgi:hypothetical protein